jgi:methyl-accepting chemotaxis protein
MLIVTAFSLGAILIGNLRSIAYREAEQYTGESVSRQRDIVANMIEKYGESLYAAGGGITTFCAGSEGLNPPDMVAFFKRLVSRLPTVSLLSYASPGRWNKPGETLAFSSEWRPPEDWDNTTRPWFTDAKKAAGKIACTDPYVSNIAGEIMAAVGINIYGTDGRDLGVVSFDIRVSDLHDILNADKRFSRQITYLINKEGLFISHEDVSKVMNNSANFFTEYHLESMKSQFLSSPSVSGEAGGVFFYSAAIPETTWGIVSVIPSELIFSEANNLLLQIVIVSFMILLIAGACAVLFTRRMLTSPIKEIDQAAASIAEMDFTVDIPHCREDEIGTIERALIKIRDSLRKAMDDLNAHVSTVTANSNRLKTAIVESSDALGTITGNMDAMKSETDTQMQSVDHTSQSILEIVKSIESLDQAIHTQAAHITESSAAIEEMVANIDAIRSVVARVTKTTDTLSKSSAAGHSMLVKLTEEINHIHEQSAALQNANKTIADMTGQTNILAMNAAIEAAHAGEAGRGFAVVAGEIRKLAELSGKESNAISEEIKKIERGMEQIAGVSHETVQSMDRIFTEIKAIDASFTQVNHAVEEQAAGGSQILIALKTILDMTGQVRDGAKTIRSQSGSIHEEMATLQRISQNVVSRAHEVKLASGSIASFLENTKALAG